MKQKTFIEKNSIVIAVICLIIIIIAKKEIVSFLGIGPSTVCVGGYLHSESYYGGVRQIYDNDNSPIRCN